MENKSSSKLGKYVAISIHYLKRFGIVSLIERFHGRYFMTGGTDVTLIVITDITQDEFFNLLNDYSNYVEKGSMHVVHDYKLPGSLDHVVLLTTK